MPEPTRRPAEDGLTDIGAGVGDETAPRGPAALPGDGRGEHAPHRGATPLELLFDLTFVVAIAASASQLHHAIVGDHLQQGFTGFAATFIAIWWAWVHYTWFASAYDTDDTRFRLQTMAQMAGVLILAAGVPAAATRGDLTIVTGGYVVMRLALVAMWWRVARERPQGRDTARRYIAGILAVQALWLGRLVLPEHPWALTWAPVMLAELLVPWWAHRKGDTPWHPHHIAERYGLFTIIVLGECVLGASNAVGGALAVLGWSVQVIVVGLGAVSLILALWWVYFLVPSGRGLHQDRRRALRWSYGHLPVFASLAALGAFIEVLADQIKAATPAALGRGAAADAVPVVAAAASDAASAASVVAGAASAVANVASAVAGTAAATPTAASAVAGAASAVAGAASAAASAASAALPAPLPPTLVIALVAAAVAVYLVSARWLARLVAPEAAQTGRLHWTASLAVLAGVVGAVAAGLPLAWALPLVTLAPVVAIIGLSSRTDATVPIGGGETAAVR